MEFENAEHTYWSVCQPEAGSTQFPLLAWLGDVQLANSTSCLNLSVTPAEIDHRKAMICRAEGPYD
jgi:hypothetical protein